MVKSPQANAGDMGSIPGSGRSPGEGNDNSIILAVSIPWTEEPGGLQFMGRSQPNGVGGRGYPCLAGLRRSPYFAENIRVSAVWLLVLRAK